MSATPEMEPHSTQTRARSVDPLAIFGLFKELNSGNDNDQADDGKDEQILPDDCIRDAALMKDD